MRDRISGGRWAQLLNSVCRGPNGPRACFTKGAKNLNNVTREVPNSEPSAQRSVKMTGSRALSSELVEQRWRNSTNSDTNLNNVTREALKSEPSAQLSVIIQ